MGSSLLRVFTFLLAVQLGLCSMIINLPSSSVSGNDRKIITDTIRTAFGLGGNSLYTAINRYHGKTPLNAWIRSPTSGIPDELYSKYGWTQLHYTTSASFSTQFVERNTTVVVSQDEVINNSSSTVEFEQTLTHRVRNLFEAGWSSESGVSTGIGFDIKYISGNRQVSSRYGRSERSESETEIGDSTRVTVNVQPRSGIMIQIVSTLKKGEARISFPTRLSDYVTANYNPRYNGHHYWALPVGNVLSSSGLPNPKTVSVTVGDALYFSKRVVIRDLMTMEVLQEFTLPEGVHFVNATAGAQPADGPMYADPLIHKVYVVLD